MPYGSVDPSFERLSASLEQESEPQCSYHRVARTPVSFSPELHKFGSYFSHSLSYVFSSPKRFIPDLEPLSPAACPFPSPMSDQHLEESERKGGEMLAF